MHIRRHNGDKPFICECGDRFITNSLLQKHRRTQGHIDESADAELKLPHNHVNNPNRKFTENDGKRTGATKNFASVLTTSDFVNANSNRSNKMDEEMKSSHPLATKQFAMVTNRSGVGYNSDDRAYNPSTSYNYMG